MADEIAVKLHIFHKDGTDTVVSWPMDTQPMKGDIITDLPVDNTWEQRFNSSGRGEVIERSWERRFLGEKGRGAYQLTVKVKLL